MHWLNIFFKFCAIYVTGICDWICQIDELKVDETLDFISASKFFGKTGPTWLGHMQIVEGADGASHHL